MKAVKWNYRIDLNGVVQQLNEELDWKDQEAVCPAVAKERICEEIKKAPPLTGLCGRVMEAESVADLNRVLELIYELADQQRVWCGLPF